MSVRLLNNNASSNTDVAAKAFPSPTSPTITPWVRNPSWPACEANAGDNRVRGLYAVWPDGGNFIAMTVSGAYTVAYGDGTTTSYASGTTAYYQYNYSAAALVGTEAPVTFTDVDDLVTRANHGYSNGMRVQFFNITTTTGISNGQFYFVINATTNTFQVAATLGGAALALTNDGTGQLLPYRVATVTITPQVANNLTSVNFYVKHNQTDLLDYSAGWLDLAYASSTITSLTLGYNYFGPAPNIRFSYLERVRLNQLGAITSFAALFQNLQILQNVVIDSSITTVTSTNSMFNNCGALQIAPSFNTASVTNMGFMFGNCNMLVEVPPYNTTSATFTNGMFNGCSALQIVPLFNTASVTNMSNMFNGCSILQIVPLFNTASVTNMSSMFISCRALQTVPLFNTASVTNMSNMFNGCANLQTVPLFNTALVANMSGMFNGCSILQTVPLFNTASVTNMSLMFQDCKNLRVVPLFNTASVTNMAQMFYHTDGTGSASTPAESALQAVPLFNTASVTSMSNMFYGCIHLQTVPLFNTALVTDMYGMFTYCVALQTVPALNVTAVSSSFNFTNMFFGMRSLSGIKAKDFRFTFSVEFCKLSATALNEIYTNLPTVVGQTITVTGNYGAATDNPGIATAKGWTVTG